ncbi:ArnT family glycosyltransferase [Trinickia mobilis]|uniref:ArnT family glycosyltransferase n=1 Tax=Trinickia mobilis TaxID=2816356 RepID=UPI001F5DF9FB|nr:glycosyl transferase [Trinickia mobilis]
MQDSSSSSALRARSAPPLATGRPVSMRPAAATPAAIPASASRASPWSGLRVALAVIAVLCAYLLPGTLGHDPWKQDETYTFGIVQHMLETGDFVVPTNAGQPFVEKPPLYDWVATGLAWLFGRYLPLHDAARLASALFMAMTLGCVARLARSATRARSWFDARVLGTLAVFAGTLVVLKHSHDMMTDVALMAGTALGFCGLFELVTAFVRRPQAVNRQASLPASAMLGAGVGIALLTKGLFVPLVFGATFCALALLYPACRSGAFLRALAAAALVFAPFALIWPVAFYLRSETLFKVWLWDNNIGRFFGFSVPALGSGNDKPLFIWRSLFSVGFPVAPLAAAALAGGAWRRWREPRVALPVVFCGTGLIVLQMSATARELYILPFIAPLALVALQGVERLPQRVHVAWDYASRALFGTIAALVWVIWSEMTDPSSTHASLKLLGRWLPLDWTLPIKPDLMLAALMLTLGWLCLVPLFARTGKWRGAFSWCAGAIAAWGLVFTLLVPWIDAAKSYRSVFEDLDTHLNIEWDAGDCMASVNLGESEAPMLYYFAGVLHKPTEAPKTTACKWLIVQSFRSDAGQPDGNWKLFWSGARPGDDSERLRVFVRRPSLVTASH